MAPKINLSMISGAISKVLNYNLFYSRISLLRMTCLKSRGWNQYSRWWRKSLSYEDSLRRLHGEFERRFEDFSVIFSMPFNVNCETGLQLELIELQCNTQLKQLFLNVPKLEFYKSLSKSTLPNLISHAQKVTMFASSYACEQVFSTMKLRKSCLRNRLTDEHLTYLLRISASQFKPNYEKLLEMQSQFHSSHSPS